VTVFRIATAADVEAVVALVESAYRGDASRAGWTTEADLLDGQRTDADAVAAIVAGPGAVLLAEENGGLAGCCQLEPSGDACYFGLFAVDPTRQGGGIGGRILDVAEQTARDRFGARTMEMTVIAQRDELIAWYERRGYTRTGETRPFPYGDERFGIPLRDDLHFVVLAKGLG
jgi:GNAT superfamily N-acetyltransferase